MTTLVLLHANYDTEHMERVKAEMATRGAPELLGVVYDDCIYLLEGCHRARAARDLGLPVRIIPVDYDPERDGQHELYRLFDRCDSDNTIGSVVGRGTTSRSCVDCDIELLDEISPDHDGADIDALKDGTCL